MREIGIIIIATNAYFVLGVRFIKKFINYYKGDSKIKFYFFSDIDPIPYLPDSINLDYYPEFHDTWLDGANSKFLNILKLENCLSEYLYFFDADTDIKKDFDEQWFLGDMVGGEHFGNRTWLKNGAGFDKNPKSKAYVPPDSVLPCTYYYGAFFGGKKENVIHFCKIIYNWQLEDKKIPYEPGVNDESYTNAYFHYNPPSLTVPVENFAFVISDKGGIGNTRLKSLNVEHLKSQMLENKDKLYEINNGLIHIVN